MSEFVHLHNHTHYSLLDAACKPDQLINAAVGDGQKAIALTDHGVMFGCYEFYGKAKKAGIKPILGFEAYISNGSRFDRSAGKQQTKKRNYFHLVLLAKNLDGYKNLMKLTTYGHTEGLYYRPRIDTDLLERYHEGIIACSACIGGVVSAPIVEGDYATALERAKYYQQLFGEDFYIELQRHNYPEDELVMRDAPKIASELGIKIVATNDIHYIKKEHAVPHNVFLAIKDASSLNAGEFDVKKLRYKTPEMYFKTKAQMIDLFRDFPESIASTVEIADKCDLVFEKKLHMPVFPISKESKAATLEEFLEELTYIGLKERFTEITQEIEDRTKYELEVIRNMGFAGYFLIVQDFVVASKKLGVRVGPGRGSAAGSLVAYALGITNINPLPYDLLFERFLNPERVSMPDIDIDFADDKREKVIEYVKQRYGNESVAQIITFGTLSSRAVLKDVGRVLGINHQDINAITAKIPVNLGKVTPLKDALELPDLKEFTKSPDPKIKELIEYSLVLEGFNRNRSLHAAGVVIAPGDVSDYVPCYQDSDMKNHGADVATQYTMNDLEDAGLLKMDFLGLRTLSIIENSLTMIEANHRLKIDIDKIDFEDAKTYDMFSAGNTQAIFQFESQGMQEYLKQLKPHSLEEITAMNALYRPGPMENIPEYIDRKFGRKPIEYLHPIMEKSLKATYGIIVYQEQVMQLARDIAGFSLGQADILRRVMGKKKQSEMEKQMPIFIDGARQNGVEKKLAMEIFNLIQKFANYGFNKSHSLAYSYLAYQTAWLKANYPAEFLAANMTAELNDQDKIVLLIEEAKKLDIKAAPPDINRSLATFTADGNVILFGLAGLKNVGINAIESVITARKDKPFVSLFDFAARVDAKAINKRVLEALICSGAFDSLNCGHRAALLNSIDSALDYAKAVHSGSNSGTESLFGGMADAEISEPRLADCPEWTEAFRLEKEKEYMNFYISGHPLNSYQPYINSLSTLNLGDKKSDRIGQEVRVCGMITEIRTRYDKRQKEIAFIKIEDFTGKAELIFWSDAYSKNRQHLVKDSVILCIGKAESDGENVKVIADEVMPIEAAAAKFSKGFNLWIDLAKVEAGLLTEVHRLCDEAASKKMIVFNVFDRSRQYKATYISEEVGISFSHKVVGRLGDLVGRNNVRLL